MSNNNHQSVSEFIPTRLRKALRLIHCLQKERGASSSLHAIHTTSSSITTNNEASGIGAVLEESKNTDVDGNYLPFLESIAIAAREETDAAFVIFLSSMTTHTASAMSSNNSVGLKSRSFEEGFPSRWEASLKRVRKCLDDSMINSKAYHVDEGSNRSGSDTDRSGSGSYRLVVMFNILIGNIIDEAVVDLIKRERENLSPEPTTKSYNSSATHSKTQYMTNNHDSRSVVSQYEVPAFAQHPRLNSADNITVLARSLPSGSPDEQQMNKNLYMPGAGNIHFGQEQGNLTAERPYQTRKNSLPANCGYDYDYRAPTQPFIGPHSPLTMHRGENKHKVRLRFLLYLILPFVRLKESIGLERSILSNLMVAKDVSAQHSSSKLLTGLVVEDANQRTIIRQLQSQSKKVMHDAAIKDLKNMLLLMEEKLKPGKEMERLQEMIRTNFDLEDLRKSMPFYKFWEVISIYMDKLYSMELILVEEIQTTWVQLSLTEKIEGFHEKKKTLSHNSLVSLYTTLNEVEDDRQHLYEIFLPQDQNGQNDKRWIDEEALQALAKKPADQIKRALLSHLKEDPTDNTIMTPSTFHTPPIDRNMEPSQIPKILKEWEIDLYEIEFRRRIGRGVGGTTYLAKWCGQDVAVKVAAITDLGVEGWHTEVNSLKRLHHPNVIRLLGSIYNPSPQTYGLVLEYCESGDLSTALQRATPSNFFWRVADDVANGMSYLHKKNILHRDIKPANVLLNGDVMGGNFTAKLSDFGVAIMHHSSVGEEHTAETGTYRWMAPEIIRHEAYSFMADVYSYALLVWQLVTHEIPFKNLSQIEAAGKVAVESARPPLPPETPELIVALIGTCWKECPEERLSFAQISVELREIHKAMSHHGKDWLGMQNGHPVYDIPPEPEQLVKTHSGKELPDMAKKKEVRRRKSGAKSPNTSSKGGGLFSIFQQNKNR